jgi:hypothetical protein
MASRVNPDGTTSFVTIAPGLTGFEFVVGSKEGKRTLTLRDAQHEYPFEEAYGSGRPNADGLADPESLQEQHNQ